MWTFDGGPHSSLKEPRPRATSVDAIGGRHPKSAPVAATWTVLSYQPIGVLFADCPPQRLADLHSHVSMPGTTFVLALGASDLLQHFVPIARTWLRTCRRSPV